MRWREARASATRRGGECVGGVACCSYRTHRDCAGGRASTRRRGPGACWVLRSRGCAKFQGFQVRLINCSSRSPDGWASFVNKGISGQSERAALRTPLPIQTVGVPFGQLDREAALPGYPTQTGGPRERKSLSFAMASGAARCAGRHRRPVSPAGSSRGPGPAGREGPGNPGLRGRHCHTSTPGGKPLGGCAGPDQPGEARVVLQVAHWDRRSRHAGGGRRLCDLLDSERPHHSPVKQ